VRDYFMKWEHIARARGILSREEGTIIKDWGGRLPIALIFPNTYYVGMSSLGLQSIYGLFNADPGVVCERIFWSREGSDRPLLALESQRPVEDFDVLAFTCSFEMDYFHIVQILRQAQIPLRAAERDETHPLLIIGGPAPSANPLPLAPIFDAFAIGEGEAIIPPLLRLLREQASASRPQLLVALAELPGLFIPHVQPSIRESQPVARQWIRDLDAHPTTSAVLTRDTEFGDMFLLEVSRGCGRGCRFCLAGHWYRPQRERSPEILLAQAEQAKHFRDRVGLVGAAISDFSQIEALIAGLRKLGMSVSVSSLRVDPLPEELLEALVESGTHTLTIAPEAGSQRLRNVIHKDVSEEALMEAAGRAAGRFPHLKLYYMVGLPTEAETDVEALIELTLAVQARFPGRLTVNSTPFVPKAHTPFQWAPMASQQTLERRITSIEAQLKPAGIEVRSESPVWARVQGVLARGDERVGEVLMQMRRPSQAGWRRACKEVGLEPDVYLQARPLGELLPWDFITSVPSRAYLERECARAMIL
jgi:radical SAM superfamily enzyme YgiQ (UPF0313 family)